jgi:hypothetical protein
MLGAIPPGQGLLPGHSVRKLVQAKIALFAGKLLPTCADVVVAVLQDLPCLQRFCGYTRRPGFRMKTRGCRGSLGGRRRKIPLGSSSQHRGRSSEARVGGS